MATAKRRGSNTCCGGGGSGAAAAAGALAPLGGSGELRLVTRAKRARVLPAALRRRRRGRCLGAG